jgi:predicted ATPase/DNA-binding CsgD family transcriptional regulator
VRNQSSAEETLAQLGNLPLELSSFVGRGQEIAEIETFLSEHRLLTLTGPGGSGKTRLALAVAARVVDAFDAGAWLVELASLSDPDLVTMAAATVLGIRETPGTPLVDSLRARLQSRKTLLVLDNCEHLVEASASLSEILLSSCPGLRILATSREALGVPGEVLFGVPPLSLPDLHRPPVIDSIPRHEATRLFVERAKSVKPSFTITGRNAMAVVQVCHRLDGMPLAIELAAARTKVLSVEQISERLRDSFALLAGGDRTALPHHRTLRATIEWSHGLLLKEEQMLFRRLSVFAGGWTLEAAEAVGTGAGIEEGEVLDSLTSLVDKSLVLVGERDSETRYRLLETVRQYTWEKLEEAGEERNVGYRHAAWYLMLSEEAEPHLKGHQQVSRLRLLEREHANLRASMQFLLREGEVETAVRLAWALWFFWYLHRHLGEGFRYSTEILEEGDTLPVGLHARALFIRAAMSDGIDVMEMVEKSCQKSVDLFRQAGDGFGLAIAVGSLGLLAMRRGNMERARTLLEQALDLNRIVGDEWGVSSVLVYMGIIPLSKGDNAQAVGYFEEALSLSRKIGDRYVGYLAHYNLALASRAGGDHEQALGHYLEGLGLAVEVGDRANAAYCLEGVAGLIATGSEPELAVRLFGASEVWLEALGAPRYAHAEDRVVSKRALRALRERLGVEIFEIAWAEGREMSPERAVEYGVLASAATPQGPPSAPAYPAGLSAREVEVLRLVAKGMTNAQIAQELSISPRTVNAHLGSVYHKIGSNTRAEAARFASEHGLL